MPTPPPDAAIVRKRLVVHGRVQGVWFRGATQQAARAAGVAGWVRNRADGAVEAVLEGAPERVGEVVAFCRVGPTAARVTRVDCTDETPEGLSGFAVR